MANKNILLVEPGYRNKYPPLGLMKVAQYHGPNGKKDNVRFVKGEDPSAYETAWDRVYITTLFSFEWERTARSIDYALNLVGGQAHRVFVGGIAASLMHETYLEEQKWRGVRFIKGLLGDAPAISLRLDPFEEELYADDVNGKPIEDLVPDYSILDHIEYEYPVTDAYFTYASRGCVRKCAFCGVPKLEGGQRDTNSLSEVIEGVNRLYGEKRDLILMDNNVVASTNFKDIITEIIDLGFERGATLKRGQSRATTPGGLQSRCRCPHSLQTSYVLATAFAHCVEAIADCLRPSRRQEALYHRRSDLLPRPGLQSYQTICSITFMTARVISLSGCVLNVTLNEELGIRIFSFPMRYQPVTRKDRGHVGKNWNSYYLRSMQVILQATHGIVSGAPDFFRKAFGDTYEEFEGDSVPTAPLYLQPQLVRAVRWPG